MAPTYFNVSAPSQPIVSQPRAVLDRYAEIDGSYREVVFENCGHSPHLMYQDRFAEELATQLDA